MKVILSGFFIWFTATIGWSVYRSAGISNIGEYLAISFSILSTQVGSYLVKCPLHGSWYFYCFMPLLVIIIFCLRPSYQAIGKYFQKQHLIMRHYSLVPADYAYWPNPVSVELGDVHVWRCLYQYGYR